MSPADSDAHKGRRHLFRWIVPCLFGAGGVLAAWFLWHIDWPHTIAAWHRLDTGTIALALALTGVSYCGLAAYDVIAVSTLRPLQIARAAAAVTGATAFGISNFLGFPLVTGTAVRVRMYGVARNDLGPLLSVVGSGWVAFWLVSIALCGAILAVRPDALLWADAATAVRLGGIILVLAVAAFLAWLGDGRSATVWQTRLDFISRRLTALQMLAAVVDIVASGLVLYLFLPPDLAGDLAGFMAIYVLAVGLGVLSHSPGGLGSFEATIMVGLGGLGRADLATGLLLYRLFRTVLPFGLAVVVLAVAGRSGGRLSAVQP
ncbi:hypothetical protein [Loktanella sp. M215]|uniref:hypothetical protein n=1 Tax=Loktanella sp. M215 TaxID=2675431 RepID=UPI001F220E02|nr:hypothetical protein [Loktanella sp. M215]MCF7698957.1 hypothetical protein [Loktanella sp. M215]